MLLQPLAYPEPDRLVQLELSSPQGNENITSIPKFNNWRAQTQVFSDVAAYDIGGPGINLTGNGLPEQLKGIRVSASYFRLFGAPMHCHRASGRAIAEDEENQRKRRLKLQRSFSLCTQAPCSSTRGFPSPQWRKNLCMNERRSKIVTLWRASTRLFFLCYHLVVITLTNFAAAFPIFDQAPCALMRG